MLIRNSKLIFGVKVLFLMAILSGPLQALVEPDRSGVGQAEFRLDELDINNEFRLPVDLSGPAASAALANLNALGASANAGRIDVRSGRWATLMLTKPLMPGRGQGNNLSWADLGQKRPANDAELAAAASQSFLAYIQSAKDDLGIDTAELAGPGNIAVHADGSLVQISMTRVFEGVPVRGSHLTATINHGNLTLFGTENWGDINTSTTPQLSAGTARDAVQSFVGSYSVSGEWGKTELALIPVAKGQNVTQVAVGDGYDHRLVWIVRPAFDGDMRHFEALVDAHTGQLLSFEDTNQYAEAMGGVYPKTNDGVGDDGTEQPFWPMPWMDIGSTTTDTGGNYDLTGSQTATFFGPYVNMADNCGTDSLTDSGGIDWGTSGGTDCTTPGFGGAGNTHASRSGFYELNRIKEMARSHLPSNTWLQGRLTANMNINNTCNAFWNGSTVNFYRSGGGCANTGEIAAVFDHEWGHGMDANDVVGGIASPSGEGIADIYSALRLYDSCIGRNFLSSPCSGNGDPCLSCTGVRDIDYLQRQSGNPHDYTWSNANCGGSVHCVGGVYSEAVWSLWKRDLQSAPYNYDNNTAAEIVTRLTYIAAGNTSTWFSGGPPSGGCAAGSGYMNYLAADDDDGNLNNGTPHMTAIYNAFNNQEIACETPTVQDSGCAGVPTSAPDVTTTSGDTQLNLSWSAVAGASSYDVFRAEGIYGCDFGKVKVGSTAGTSFTDTGLQNLRDYSYVVIPKSGASCFGPASACDTDQPGQIPCTVDADCNDGAFCNGEETCDAGFCAVASDPCAANPTWSCDEDADICVPECDVDADCADGAFCNGDEICNAGTCEPGSDPCPGQSCDEGGNICTDTNGPQDADYDAGLGAPACAIRGSSCDSTTLVDGRASLGPEPNQPNTLDGCADGTSGTYHSDESNDRIVVFSLDGQDFREGQTVQIDATVWAWSTGSSDAIDLYYTADANNPSWNYITSITPPAGGAQTLSAQYVLPAGELQAVRANFRYSGSASACSPGAYDDHDDLVFAVGSSVECTIDADCADGAFCNGDETCNAGVCDAGTPVVCDDSVSCTVDSCNEGTDSCDNVADDAICDNGLFCDGSETCDAVLDCQAGTAPCNPETETCNEAGDICETIGCTVDADCTDGTFCNGAETCNVGTGICEAGTPPVMDDGVGCTDDSCDEVNDVIVNAPNDGNCDNGEFCDGSETCDAVNDCQAGSMPCAAGESCDEVGDVCVPSPVCDNDGVCETDEDCLNCANDCISGTIPGAVCGNGVCEAGDGENALTCSADCNSTLNGKPSGRFACGFNDGYGPEACDSRCNAGGNTCTETPVGPAGDFCCGDDTCEGDENSSTCSLDCGAPAVCGNGIIEFGEMCDGSNLDGETCSSQGYPGGDLACSGDCAAFDVSGCDPLACVPTHDKEKGPRCSDGLDNDCDGLIDGLDPDC